MPDRGLARLPHLLNAAAVLIMFGFAFLTYDSLPDPIPIHFDGQGNPDGWTEKTLFNWLLLPLAGLLLTGIIYASARLVNLARKKPHLLSIPYKEKFLNLPPEKQEPIWRSLKSLIHCSLRRTIAETGISQMGMSPRLKALV